MASDLKALPIATAIITPANDATSMRTPLPLMTDGGHLAL